MVRSQPDKHIVPSWPIVGESDIDARSFLFFKNRQSPASYIPKTNHVQLVAAGSSDQKLTKGLTSALNDGPTVATNWSWIFTDRIASACNLCSPAQLNNFVASVTVHEIGHQWNVNREFRVQEAMIQRAPGSRPRRSA